MDSNKLYYSLRIKTDEANYKSVSRILSLEVYNFSRGWVYEIEQNGDDYFDFIGEFLDILEGKFNKLSELGIVNKDISVWLIYEYTGQCNLEFAPEKLKRLGDNGIVLCISCYEGG